MPISILNPGGDTLLSRHELVSLPYCHFRSFYQQTQIRKKFMVCAKNKRRQHGSATRSRKLVESAFYIASKLQILPAPVDFFIQEFGIGGGGGGGNRGGFSGFRKGFGWGGFDGWWRSRRSKRKLNFLAVLLVSGIGLWFVLGKRLNAGDAFLGGFGGLVLLGLSIHGWRRGVKDWIVGFCCCAFLYTVVQVDTSCCKECPRALHDALLKLGVEEVEFSQGNEEVCISGTVDPFIIVKEIAKMNKPAELVFYAKYPMPEDRTRNAKGPEEKSHPRDEHKQNTRDKCKEKCHCSPQDRDTRDTEDGRFKGDNGYRRRGNCKNCPDHHDSDDETSDHYRTRNVREKDQRRFSRCHNYARGSNNGPKKHSQSRNYDRRDESSEDEKTPKPFFDPDADMFKGFRDRQRSGSCDQNDMPSMDGNHFRSRSGMYEHFPNFGMTPPYPFDPTIGPEPFVPRMPPHQQYGPTMPHSYEQEYDPSMRPPWPPRASPYYSDFYPGNSNSCSIM
ncbi:OLC1v1000496C1 [Oldenlandia corymbosa var. corymbosa]|uniref:OLC1v1000496C1 n=1 Tax=Oldenlandia corymbosa var. corymbosa TaxID=529605 RepID=A0AAV1D575_OLDCO|nr:OLC1v1000496C1 [Oldenlandia corymbosa var. corymbosa]